MPTACLRVQVHLSVLHAHCSIQTLSASTINMSTIDTLTRFGFVPCLAHASRRFTPPFVSPRRPPVSSPHQRSQSQHQVFQPQKELSPQQIARLRLHLMRASRRKTEESKTDHNQQSQANSEKKRTRRISEEQCAARSERMRSKWNDPDWRAEMLSKRRTEEAVSKQRENARRLWRDPEFRAKMRESRMGRVAWNKGVSPTAVTRLRMSESRKGVPKSQETRQRMSAAKSNRKPNDDWPRLISEGKKGKTREYYQLRKEFHALHKDLRLWSDSYLAKYGRLPNVTDYERYVAPMMVFRIRRYLTLREAIGNDETGVKREIISQV